MRIMITQGDAVLFRDDYEETVFRGVVSRVLKDMEGGDDPVYEVVLTDYHGKDDVYVVAYSDELTPA